MSWAKGLAVVFGVGGILGSIGGIVSGLGVIAAHPALAAVAAIAAALTAAVVGIERLKSIKPEQVKDTATDRRRQFGKVGGAMSSVGGVMALTIAGNLPAAQELFTGIGPASDDRQFADAEVRRAIASLGAFGGMVRGQSNIQSAVRSSALQEVAVKVTLDGPAAGAARVTAVEGGNATVEKRVGVRTAGSTP